MVAVSRYNPGSRPCEDIFSTLAGLKYLTSLELVAPAGLGGEITVGAGWYTLSIPPSASGILLERLSAVSKDMPVTAHPLIGKFHVVCSDSGQIGIITKTVLALGSKHPVEWGSVVSKGITGLFTESKLTVALSLKHELDPEGILNPHLIQK